MFRVKIIDLDNKVNEVWPDLKLHIFFGNQKFTKHIQKNLWLSIIV